MRQSPENQWSYEIGREKQRMVMSALQELENEKKIQVFFPTTDLSFQDIVKGIDFFIGYSDGKRRRVRSFSVTGEAWAEGDRKKHPKIPVIVISLSDTSDHIKSEILKVINQNK